MRSIFVVVAVLVRLPVSGAAPVPPPTVSSEEIKEAIHNLDDPQYRVRSLAAKKLLAAGPAAVEPLAVAAKTGSAESADRAMKILEELALHSDAATMRLTRDALRQLAKSGTQAREPAREILRRHRGQVLDRMQQAGAVFQFDDDRARAVYLNAVEDLKAILPHLAEFPELEEVSLENKKFGDDEMKYLLPLTNLKWLNLFMSNVGDEGLKHLKNFPKLESIPMGRTRITDEGLKHLAGLTQLEYVGLRGNNVTDAGLVHLKKLTNLTALTLEETKVTGAGFVHLRGMTKLDHLRLHSAPIDDDGAAKLHAIKSLRRIDLTLTRVSAAGREKLREAIPEAIVVTGEGQ